MTEAVKHTLSSPLAMSSSKNNTKFFYLGENIEDVWPGGKDYAETFSDRIIIYIIIRVHSAFSLVASCVLLKYTRTDDVNWWRELI